ncbi:MAG: hypothetical protein ACE5F3_07785 [Mariprofundaceae bacterium]
MAQKKPRVMNIVIFGVCLFSILLLIEYKKEVGEELRWIITAPLVFIGLYFGLRAAAPPEDEAD